MWDDYRASLEEYDAPDLDWNSLAGLGTWTAYTAFKNIVEGMSGDITGETFLEAANTRSLLHASTEPYDRAAMALRTRLLSLGADPGAVGGIGRAAVPA